MSPTAAFTASGGVRSTISTRFKIGLTATSCVMRDADDIDEEARATIRDTLRFFEVNRPAFTYTQAEAIADGHLVPYEIYRAVTARTAATDGFAVRRDEIDWDALQEPTRAELEALFAEHDPLIVDPTVLERKFTIPERNRAMVREFRQVLESGYTGPNGIRRVPDWGKTIVFAVTKVHAETLDRMLGLEFADKKPSLAVLHGVEAVFWAAAYLWLGALGSLGAAVLYSIDAMATRGASGLMLPPHWQMMGALEAADGMLLFGISTAFIFTVMLFYYQHLVLQSRSGSVEAI